MLITFLPYVVKSQMYDNVEQYYEYEDCCLVSGFDSQIIISLMQ